MSITAHAFGPQPGLDAVKDWLTSLGRLEEIEVARSVYDFLCNTDDVRDHHPDTVLAALAAIRKHQAEELRRWSESS